MPFKDLHYRIFEKGENDPGHITRLQQIVKDYPYFSLAHFFLLKATKQRDAGYDKIAARTALHFSNPFFLQDQLLRKKEDLALVETAHSTYLTDDEEQTNIAEGALEDVPAVDTESLEVTTVPDAVEVTSPAETEQPQDETEEPAENVPDPVAITLPETPLEPSADELSVPAEEQPKVNIHKTQSEPPLFQPLFASDYFASQGIKFSEQVQTDDKLGKQLKSFTEWLKTMKKVHQEKATDETAEDVAVQTLADRSNREEVVLTESMAEVYLQQGKRRKAREIYEKLSLLNPAKSAYFAAKIDAIQIN